MAETARQRADAAIAKVQSTLPGERREEGRTAIRAAFVAAEMFDRRMGVLHDTPRLRKEPEGDG